MKTLFILISLVLSLAHGAGAGAVPAAGAGAVPAAVECCQIAPRAGKMPPVIVVIRADDGAAGRGSDVGAVSVAAPAAHAEYKRMTTVYSLEHADDAVIVVDSDGELWEFYGVEDWAVGDYCELTMIDAGKPGYKWDDEITRTIYKGVNETFE